MQFSAILTSIALLGATLSPSISSALAQGRDNTLADQAVMDMAHRGTIAVRGADRVDFLNRMVTQELKDMAGGDVRAGFWLNRKGRIEADLDGFARDLRALLVAQE